MHKRKWLGLSWIVAGDCDLSLRKKVIPEFEREVIGDTHNDAEKVVFELWMATSAALQRWQPGGMSSRVILYLSLMRSFMAEEILLSRMCLRGVTPARCSRSMRAV